MSARMWPAGVPVFADLLHERGSVFVGADIIGRGGRKLHGFARGLVEHVSMRYPHELRPLNRDARVMLAIVKERK